jgi:hypothetical protein
VKECARAKLEIEKAVCIFFAIFGEKGLFAVTACHHDRKSKVIEAFFCKFLKKGVFTIHDYTWSCIRGVIVTSKWQRSSRRDVIMPVLHAILMQSIKIACNTGM